MNAGPTTEARRIGESLRSLRIAAQLTGMELAERAGMSQSKVSKLETGRQLPSDPDVLALAQALRLPTRQRDRLVEDVAQARNRYRPWNYVGPRLIKSQKYIAEAERAATVVRECSQALVPGLLQTPGYTKALLELLPYEVDVSAVAGERLARQQILFDIEDRTFKFLVFETALRATVGSPQVMKGQLDRLLTLNDNLANLEVRVLPSDVVLPAPILSDFAVYDDRLVDIELLVGQVAIEEPSSVQVYVDVFERMWVEAQRAGGTQIIRQVLAGLLED